MHSWKTAWESYYSQNVIKGYCGGYVGHEICVNCGWEAVSEFGNRTVKKPWQMTVRKCSWSKLDQAYFYNKELYENPFGGDDE